MRSNRSGRTLTVLAVGFLLLDGALLLLAGMWSGRLGLIVWGTVFVLGAIGVGAYWKRHTRHLRELQEALQTEAMELHRLTQGIEEKGS